MALYSIQRKKTPRNPGPDHDPSWDLTWWNNRDACWVDEESHGTTVSSKARGEDVIRVSGLREGNPGDEITLVEMT